MRASCMNKLHLTRFLLDNHRVPTWDFKIRLKLKDKKYPISMEVKQRFKKTLNTNIYPKILYFYTYLHKYSSIQPIKFTHTRHPVFLFTMTSPPPFFIYFSSFQLHIFVAMRPTIIVIFGKVPYNLVNIQSKFGPFYQ